MKKKILYFPFFLLTTSLFAQLDGTSALVNYLQENNISAQKTPEGLHYLVTKKGNGTSPTKGDYALLSYRAMLLDSTVFDQSEVDNPFVFQVGNHEVIKGLDQGVQLLKKGGAATLFVPPALGYQQYGVQGAVPPDAALIYEVELLDVMDFDNYDQYMRELEEKERKVYEQRRRDQFQQDLKTIETYAEAHNLIVRRTNSGLSYVITKAGKGVPPKPGSLVKVAYEGFLTDDTSFDKSEKFEFTLGAAKVIEGWEEGLQHFAPGSEGWLLVPSKLAYGPLPVGKIPANSVLIFKIKMLKN